MELFLFDFKGFWAIPSCVKLAWDWEHIPVYPKVGDVAANSQDFQGPVVREEGRFQIEKFWTTTTPTTMPDNQPYEWLLLSGSHLGKVSMRIRVSLDTMISGHQTRPPVIFYGFLWFSIVFLWCSMVNNRPPRFRCASELTAIWYRHPSCGGNRWSTRPPKWWLGSTAAMESTGTDFPGIRMVVSQNLGTLKNGWFTIIMDNNGWFPILRNPWMNVQKRRFPGTVQP